MFVAVVGVGVGVVDVAATAAAIVVGTAGGTEDFAAISLREKAPSSQKQVEGRPEPIWLPEALLMRDVRLRSRSIPTGALLRPTQVPLGQSPKDPDPHSAFSSSNSRSACASSSV